MEALEGRFLDFEIETIVRAVRVNQGPTGAFAPLPAVSEASTSTVAGRPEAAPAGDDASMQRAREACLERKVEAAQVAQRKKRFGKLLGAVGRVMSRYGGSDLASDVARVTREVFDANATVDDVAEAAEALGITPEDIAECRDAH